ncbi:DNA end-binding protein Ku [Thermoanaerobacter thermohydrosulfuricus]|uniref:Non-homologous end joining protein Ku n=2 Tax=Thermoanaerobacter thermohydrosulfuricus TaxID=1516 RepID=M8DDZ2_THETY|nr:MULTISPECIES: Ku protein [Thermoanaerobacter]EMT38257.1 Ku protein, prokaryotic [Thermoanaerobacter thermohydrosulfuricus WC1]SDF69090.1 DNA end-binding protein Ku [Thermoanaerobacter thermohydrosulfuricus]SFE12055.1 DNA end-binding protein Ku [Thermoanaerobacter thermohydrosulfuricus]
MRSMWKGAISFGLVSIPIKLYTATEDHAIHFRQLHKECKSPIKYEKICPVCNRPVSDEEIVRGYEYEPGKFVIIDDEDLERIPMPTVKTIDIVDFTDIGQIDPIYYDKTYFIVPEDIGTKPYVLLRDSMKETKRVAIAKVVIRSKQNLACIRVYDEKYMVLETMHFPDEIKNANQLPPLREVSLQENEIKMAKQLIDTLTSDFKPEKYDDSYRKALIEMIESKIQDKDVEIPQKAPEADNVLDLVSALKASIESVKNEEKAKKGRKRKGA